MAEKKVQPAKLPRPANPIIFPFTKKQLQPKSPITQPNSRKNSAYSHQRSLHPKNHPGKQISARKTHTRPPPLFCARDSKQISVVRSCSPSRFLYFRYMHAAPQLFPPSRILYIYIAIFRVVVSVLPLSRAWSLRGLLPPFRRPPLSSRVLQFERPGNCPN